MHPQIEIHFIVTGIFDPEKLSEVIGMQPTKSWRVGETVAKSSIVRKFDGWKLSLSLIHSYELDEEIKKIISLLAPHKSKIKEFCKKYALNVEFLCGITIEGDAFPSIHFDRKLLKEINELNAEIDIDIV